MPIALPELLAHMPDGLVVLDQRGVVMACNDAAPHLLATPQRDWNGREFLDVIAGSPLEIDLRALLAPPIVAATRQLIYERADDMRAVELRLRPLYADDPGAGALLVVRDRTDRARLEQAREQRVRELSALNRLARAANSALETDELLRAITRELAQILPSVRVAIGLLQPDGTTMRLVVDGSLRTASTLEAQAVTEYDVTQLQHILRAGQPLDDLRRRPMAGTDAAPGDPPTCGHADCLGGATRQPGRTARSDVHRPLRPADDRPERGATVRERRRAGGRGDRSHTACRRDPGG